VPPLPGVDALTCSLVAERLSKRGEPTNSGLHQAPRALSSIAILAASATTSTTLCKNVACVGHPRLKRRTQPKSGSCSASPFPKHLPPDHFPRPHLLLPQQTPVSVHLTKINTTQKSAQNGSPEPCSPYTNILLASDSATSTRRFCTSSALAQFHETVPQNPCHSTLQRIRNPSTRDNKHTKMRQSQPVLQLSYPPKWKKKPTKSSPKFKKKSNTSSRHVTLNTRSPDQISQTHSLTPPLAPTPEIPPPRNQTPSLAPSLYPIPPKFSNPASPP
jgi:hypothetical protein